MTLAFVAYHRVSTNRQGRSGLGLDAQREAVARFLAGHPGAALLGEFTEVESGSRADRPQLAAALALARRRRATLVIAKLDRLARSVAFIAGLMEGGAPFVVCDNPHATPLTIHMLAAVAQHEREAISARTKAALAVAKARGTRLGNPDAGPARVLAAAANRAAAARRIAAMRPLAERLAGQGLSLRAVARELAQSPHRPKTAKLILLRKPSFVKHKTFSIRSIACVLRYAVAYGRSTATEFCDMFVPCSSYDRTWVMAE